VRVYNVRPRGKAPARVDLAFDDDPRNFEIERPERKAIEAPKYPNLTEALEAHRREALEFLDTIRHAETEPSR
jgi:hypothetical protein